MMGDFGESWVSALGDEEGTGGEGVEIGCFGCG